MIKKILILIMLTVLSCKSSNDVVAETKETTQKKCSDGNLKDCHKLGLIEYEKGNKTEAIKLLTKACDGGPEGAMGCTELGAIEENQENIAKARKLYTKACNSGDNGVGGCTYLAKLEDHVGNTDLAIKFHSKACNSGGDGISSCVNLGAKEEDRGNDTAAKKLYSKSCDHQFGFGCFMAGRLELREGHKDLAKTYNQKACKYGYENACEQSQNTYKACVCNFNNCMERRSTSCVHVEKCSTTNADVYADQVHNRKALLVLDAHRFCAEPLQGIMRGD